MAVHGASEPFGANHDEIGYAQVFDVRRAGVFEQARTMIPGARWCDPSAVAIWSAELPADRLGLVLVGAIGYGLSLRFYLLAQRAFGAARTGSVFAFAPFIGAAVALALGDRSASWGVALGGILMLAGVLLHLGESHDHEHVHAGLDHEQAHRHDDGHHDHAHPSMPAGEHSHRHRHEPTRHAHPHVPDAHHDHGH